LFDTHAIPLVATHRLDNQATAQLQFASPEVQEPHPIPSCVLRIRFSGLPGRQRDPDVI